MGGNNSTTAAAYAEGKIFGPNGKLMDVNDMLKMQEDLKKNYEKLSDVTEKEKKALMPKLFKLYDLIDAWRSDIDLHYRDSRERMKAAADHHDRVSEQILGSLVSLLFILPGLQSAYSAVEIGNILKASVTKENDMGAFAGKGVEAAKYLYTIASNLTDSYKQASTFEGLLLKASENMRSLLCNPTEEQWKSLQLLSKLDIDRNLNLYNAIREAMVEHTRPFVYGYVFSTNFHFKSTGFQVGNTFSEHVSLHGKKWWGAVDDEGIKSEIEGFMKINPQHFWEGTIFKRCDKNCTKSHLGFFGYENIFHPITWRNMTIYAQKTVNVGATSGTIGTSHIHARSRGMGPKFG